MAEARREGFPETVFIHRASVEAAEQFFAKRAPDANAIYDANGTLAEAFGIARGSLMQLLGPVVWWRGLRALLKGNFVGKPSAHAMQMPGAFLVRGREVLWSYRAKHAGDHPVAAEIPSAANLPSAASPSAAS